MGFITSLNDELPPLRAWNGTARAEGTKEMLGYPGWNLHCRDLHAVAFAGPPPDEVYREDGSP